MLHSVDDLGELLDHLDEQIGLRGCDRTLAATTEWLAAHDYDVDRASDAFRDSAVRATASYSPTIMNPTSETRERRATALSFPARQDRHSPRTMRAARFAVLASRLAFIFRAPTAVR